MNAEKIREYAECWLKENSDEFNRLSDFIWENPELGLEEFGAFSAITELLRKNELGKVKSKCEKN